MELRLYRADLPVLKYNALSNEKRTVQKLWQRVKFGNGEIQDLDKIRSELATHTQAITLFLNILGLGSQGKVERYMESHGDELREIKASLNWVTAKLQVKEGATHREKSILSSYAGDDKEDWKMFRRELIRDGFSSRVLSTHKETIKKYVVELGERGVLDDVVPDEVVQEEVVPVYVVPDEPVANTAELTADGGAISATEFAEIGLLLEVDLNGEDVEPIFENATKVAPIENVQAQAQEGSDTANEPQDDMASGDDTGADESDDHSCSINQTDKAPAASDEEPTSSRQGVQTPTTLESNQLDDHEIRDAATRSKKDDSDSDSINNPNTPKRSQSMKTLSGPPEMPQPERLSERNPLPLNPHLVLYTPNTAEPIITPLAWPKYPDNQIRTKRSRSRAHHRLKIPSEGVHQLRLSSHQAHINSRHTQLELAGFQSGPGPGELSTPPDLRAVEPTRSNEPPESFSSYPLSHLTGMSTCVPPVSIVEADRLNHMQVPEGVEGVEGYASCQKIPRPLRRSRPSKMYTEINARRRQERADEELVRRLQRVALNDQDDDYQEIPRPLRRSRPSKMYKEINARRRQERADEELARRLQRMALNDQDDDYQRGIGDIHGIGIDYDGHFMNQHYLRAGHNILRGNFHQAMAAGNYVQGVANARGMPSNVLAKHS